MSYCVNCGVELAPTEKSCPLCLVEVVNPKSPYDPDIEPAYPDVPVAGIRRNHRDLIAPIALIMLIPVCICLIFDYLTTGGFGWSLFVFLSLMLLSVFLLPPLAMNRPHPVVCLLIDWLATFVFLLLLDTLTRGEWFYVVGLPISLIGGAAVVGVATLIFYAGMRKLVKLSLALFATGFVSVLADFLIKRRFSGGLAVGWSLYVLVPCVILALVALVVNHNQRLKEQVKQRFFW